MKIWILQLKIHYLKTKVRCITCVRVQRLNYMVLLKPNMPLILVNGPDHPNCEDGI